MARPCRLLTNAGLLSNLISYYGFKRLYLEQFPYFITRKTGPKHTIIFSSSLNKLRAEVPIVAPNFFSHHCIDVRSPMI